MSSRAGSAQETGSVKTDHLKEHQAGLPVAEICRRHGISDATFYTWSARSTAGSRSRRPSA